MLAKIAFGFVVLEYGLEGLDDVFVIPAILGQSNDLGRWVGTCDASLYFSPRMNNGEVAQYVIRNEAELLVFFQLFGSPTLPTYVVVVGAIHHQVVTTRRASEHP